MYALFLIILIGAFLRFYMINSESIWLDEAASYQFAKSNIFKIITGEIHDPAHPFLYFILLHFWIKLFGFSEVGLRSLSAIFGISSIPLMYIFGKKLFNAETGLMAALLLSISSLHIYCSQEARMYSLAMFLTLSAVLFCYQGLMVDKKIFWICYVIFSTLSLYTHYMAVFVLFSIAVFFIFFYWKDRHLLKIMFVSHVSIVLFYLPEFKNFVLPTFITQKTYWYWQPRFELKKLGRIFEQWGIVSDISPFIVIFIMSAITITIILFWWKKGSSMFPLLHQKADFQPLSFLLIYFLFPILVVFIFSLRLLVLKYFIIILPAGLLIVAKSSMSIIKKTLEQSMILTVWVFILISLVNTYSIYILYRDINNEQWREAVNFIENNSFDDQIILINAPEQEMSFRYYYNGGSKIVSIPKPDIPLTESGVYEITSNYRGVLLIYSHSKFSDPEKVILKSLENFYEKVYYRDFFSIQIFLFRNVNHVYWTLARVEFGDSFS